MTDLTLGYPLPEAGRGGERDDQELARTAASDPAAFEHLYRRHVERVYRYLSVRLGSEQDAQDLTAQTFLTAMENISSFRGDGPFAAWLIGIARLKVAAFYRNRHSLVALEAAHNHPYAGSPPELATADRLQLERVARAMQAIASDRAEALSLCFFAGLNTEEAARVMGRSKDAVKMLVHRGLRDLRQRLVTTREEQNNES